MFSHVADYLVIFGILIVQNLIFPVKSQCTVESCETGDSSISIASEIRQMIAEFHERLQAIDRRSQEQDICIKQVQSMHELLNASTEQMKNQHTTVLMRLEEVKELLLDHDISTKNDSQNLWKLAIGATLQPTAVFDLGNESTLIPSSNGWTIIMNRFNGSLSFNRSWTEYKNGFGEIGRGEFWLGNEIVHRLTNRCGVVHSLRVEVQLYTSKDWYYALYDTFSLDSESNKYAIRLSGFSGNASDALTDASLPANDYSGGMNFSTWDNDNDGYTAGSCAGIYSAGWWFNGCGYSYLTCPYGSTFKWRFSDGRLRAARMLIKNIVNKT